MFENNDGYLKINCNQWIVLVIFRRLFYRTIWHWWWSLLGRYLQRYGYYFHCRKFL